jgi:hypothetical protein
LPKKKKQNTHTKDQIVSNKVRDLLPWIRTAFNSFLTIFAPFVVIIHDINISSSFDAVLGLFHSFHGFPWLNSGHKEMINPLILPSHLPKPTPPAPYPTSYSSTNAAG